MNAERYDSGRNGRVEIERAKRMPAEWKSNPESVHFREKDVLLKHTCGSGLKRIGTADRTFR